MLAWLMNTYVMVCFCQHFNIVNITLNQVYFIYFIIGMYDSLSQAKQVGTFRLC